ncbi:FAD-binding protein [Actinokineospora sp. 24-640]
MTRSVSRRGILRGGAAAGAAAVVGWSAANSMWVTTAQAAPAGMASVPTLEGTLDYSAAALTGFGKDFGELVTGAPQAVLRPGSVNDIVKMVQFARRNRLTIAMNGQSGNGTDLESHSNYGQALTRGGIAIDSRGLNKIHYISRTHALVDAGVTLAQLTDAALAQGLTPVGLTDYLHLSIGGTISVGGVGGTVQKFGLQCDVAEAIEIVTGTGELLTASAGHRTDLLESALGGNGQFGIITKALVKLVPAPTKALVQNLFYNSLDAFVADQEKIMLDGRFSHQEGEIVRTPDGSGWRYKIEAVSYYTDATAPDRARLLSGLCDVRSDIQVTEYPYRDWLFRLDPLEVLLKEGGFWTQAKPWLSLVVPSSTIKRFIPSVVSELVPEDLGVGFSGLYPLRRSKLTRPFFMLPENREEKLWLFDLLRFPFPDDPGISRMLEQNRRLYDLGVSLGAKRYTVGAIPGMTGAQWRTHFGRNWTRLVDAKRRYDPDRVLTPGQGFFA